MTERSKSILVTLVSTAVLVAVSGLYITAAAHLGITLMWVLTVTPYYKHRSENILSDEVITTIRAGLVLSVPILSMIILFTLMAASYAGALLTGYSEAYPVREVLKQILLATPFYMAVSIWRIERDLRNSLEKGDYRHDMGIRSDSKPT